MIHGRRVAASALTLSTLVLTGCAIHNRTWFEPSSRPSADLYRCVLLELGRAEYVVTDADRDAGFVKAQRAPDSFFEMEPRAIVATVVPEGGEEPAYLQITGTAHAEEDAAAVLQECTG